MANTKAKDDYFYVRGIFTEIISDEPKEIDGQKLPALFRATFYIIDNQGRKLNNSNFKQLPTWTIELILKANNSGYVEAIQCTAKGARDYTDHNGRLSHSFDFFTGKPKEYPITEYQALTARHYSQIEKYRAKLIGQATARALDTHEYLGENYKGNTPNVTFGKHHWTYLGAINELPDDIILNIIKSTQKRAYTKITDSFLQDLARKYLAIIEAGDLTPTKTLHEQHYSTLVGYDRLSAYLTECRELGLIPRNKPKKGRK